MANPRIQTGIEEADALIKSASRSGIGMTIQQMRVDKALVVLRKLESECRSENDLVPVRERTLSAQCKLITLLTCDGILKRDVSSVFYHVEEALSTWSWLYTQSPHQLYDCAAGFRQLVMDLVSDPHHSIDRPNFLVAMQKVLQTATRKCKDPFILAARFETSHQLLEDSFHVAIRHYEDGKWVAALNVLKSKASEVDVLVEMEERQNTIGEPLDFSDWGLWDAGDDRASILRNDFDLQLAVCQGAQLIHMGDLHFGQAMQGDPDDMMSRALLAQDDYRAALGFVSGLDVELEGMALARLARFHAKITKIPVSAHQLYLRAVQLATALQPALPKGSWYKECVDAVQAYRDSLEAEEQKQWESKRKPILERLSPDIEKLNGANGLSDMEFVKFVFENWPPKTEGPKTPPSDPNSPNTLSKKHLLKVIQRYHVDKNFDRGDEWKVMSEEISKSLTARYNIMKGV